MRSAGVASTVGMTAAPASSQAIRRMGPGSAGRVRGARSARTSQPAYSFRSHVRRLAPLIDLARRPVRAAFVVGERDLAACRAGGPFVHGDNDVVGGLGAARRRRAKRGVLRECRGLRVKWMREGVRAGSVASGATRWRAGAGSGWAAAARAPWWMLGRCCEGGSTASVAGSGISAVRVEPTSRWQSAQMSAAMPVRGGLGTNIPTRWYVFAKGPRPTREPTSGRFRGGLAGELGGGPPRSVQMSAVARRQAS